MSSDKPHKLTQVRSKKSETLEVRIPHETKQAFLTACREDGTTASEVVREHVQTYLDARERPLIPEKRTLVMKLPQPIRHYGPRIAAGGLAAIGLATFVALPSAAAPDFKAQFSRLDTNGDGVLSAEEFLGPKEEASADAKEMVVETRTIMRTGKDAEPIATPSGREIEQEAFTFWLPEELGAGKDAEQRHEYKFISHREVQELKDGEAAPLAAHTFTLTVDDLRRKEFDSIDADRDGKVSLAEYRTRQTAMLTRGFELLDANSDKALSQEEYAKIVSPPMKIRVHADDPQPPEPPTIEIPGLKKISPEALKAAFMRLDANKDDKLSLQEYLPAS